jgi:mono/diheme cytochrome c family protein
MTEIPEHLLRRSRERREALGLATPSETAPTADASTAVEPAEGAPAAAAAPVAPAAPAPMPPAPTEAPPPPPPKPQPPYVQAALRRKRIPWWAMPVLASLPVWAGVYAFTLEPPSAGESDPLVLGEELYNGEGTCAACHGAGGQGGVGPSFQEGAVVETWPNWQNHVAWVSIGGQEWPEDTYGAPEKPVGGVGVMPGFGGTLTPEQIALIVRYEREVLAGAEPDEELVALTDAIAAGETTTATGESVTEALDAAVAPGDGPGGTSEPPPSE